MISVNSWIDSFIRSHEFRVSPNDSRLVETRQRLGNARWEYYGRYGSPQVAKTVVEDLQEAQVLA